MTELIFFTSCNKNSSQFFCENEKLIIPNEFKDYYNMLPEVKYNNPRLAT